MPLSPDRDRDRDRRSMRSPPGKSRMSGSSSGRPMGGSSYKVLCVSALHPKASDDVIRDSLYREYKKYGDISVRVIQEPDERVAYVYFRNFEDAREAKHSKSRIILFDKAAMVEPVYESRSSAMESSYRGRPRSMSPHPPSYGHPRYRSRSPLPDRGDRYHHRDYRDDYHHHHHPHHGPREYYHRDTHRSHMDDGIGRGRGRGHGHGRGGYGGYHGDSYRGEKRENKKDKFPNYLNHIPPEDDPLATRTLFTGNLELNITEEEMRRIFGRYGKLVDIDIKRPPPGTGNAYAFIRYENLDQAARAKVELSGQYIGKFQCKIGYGKVNATPKVWIGGLGSWTSESLLEREFDRFGAIQKIEYHKGDHEGFIYYETLEAAEAAVQEMRGFPLGGPEKRIRIDYSDLENYNSPSGPPTRKPHHDVDPGYSGDRYDRSRYTYIRGRGGHNSYGRDRGYENDRMPPSRSGRRVEPADDEEFSSPDRLTSSLSNAKSIAELIRIAPKVWEGGLILKNSLFPSRLQLIHGDSRLADHLKDELDQPHLKITQRLRLEQSKLDEVNRRIINANSIAVFLSTSTGSNIQSDIQSPDIQSRPLRNLITYLKQKEAAGVISLNSDSDVSGIFYCFPACDFSYDLLKREVPDLNVEDGKDDHLVILVVSGSSN